MTEKDRLKIALTCLAGPGLEDQKRLLRQYSAFTPMGAEEEIATDDLEGMSEKWAFTTRDKLMEAVREGKEHFNFNEQGERVQFKLFD